MDTAMEDYKWRLLSHIRWLADYQIILKMIVLYYNDDIHVSVYFHN